MIGDVVNVKEVIPTVSVETVEEVTYHEAIACPVETQEDSSMYKGDSKILVQGEEGEALVEAHRYLCERRGEGAGHPELHHAPGAHHHH